MMQINIPRPQGMLPCDILQQITLYIIDAIELQCHSFLQPISGGNSCYLNLFCASISLLLVICFRVLYAVPLLILLLFYRLPIIHTSQHISAVKILIIFITAIVYVMSSFLEKIIVVCSNSFLHSSVQKFTNVQNFDNNIRNNNKTHFYLFNCSISQV